MLFVVVTVNKNTANVVCVDGPFPDSEAATEHAAKVNSLFNVGSMRNFKASAELVTTP